MSEKKQPAIIVSNIKKSFRIPLDGSTGIKQKIVNGLTNKKGYRTFTPLNDISFTIEEGEFFGIVGRNGSGKSTLLKTMAGIYTPDGGYVKVNGTLVPFIELGVGFNPELTGRENVYLNGALLGFSRDEMTAMYEEIVDFAELHDFMEERLKNYSSGMQVRLAFSIAIRAQGDILLLDEVLAVGDSSFQQKCYDYFEQLKREQRTIILVTHSMDAVKRFCSRALLLKDGEIKLIGSPEEVADQYLLDNIENGGTETSMHKKTTGVVNQFDFMMLSARKVISKDSLRVSVRYTLKSQFKPTIGLSIICNGRSAAEINSIQTKLGDKADNVYEVVFETSLVNFNPGEYHIDAALFRADDMSLVAYHTKGGSFVIAGNDQSRGGPMKLTGSWTLKKRD